MSKFTSYIKSTNRKSLKYGSASAVLIISVIAVVVVLNLIVNTLVSSNVLPLKWDASENAIYSISDQSIKVLKDVKKDIEIYVMNDASDSNIAQIKEILSQYRKYSSRIEVTYSDPDKNPGIISQIDPAGLHGIKKGNFVVKSGSKIRVLDEEDIVEVVYDENSQTGETTASDMRFIGEQSFTGAILFVTSDETPVVYFMQGHGEPSLTDNYSGLQKQLEANNYEVKTLNIIASGNIPDDAEIIMAAAPKTDLSAKEKSLISEYLNNGGKAILLFDYIETKATFPRFDDLLTDYNLGLDYDKVKENDSSRYYPGNQYSIIAEVKSNDIIKEQSAILLNDARSIKILSNEKSTLTVTPLIVTSSAAEGVLVDKSKGNNINGPLNLAVAVANSGSEKPSKILVVGNGSFISDKAQSEYGIYYEYGENFFTEALNWMTDKKDSIVIESKSVVPGQLTISNSGVIWIMVLTVIILPLIIFAAGIIVWLRRRHL